MKRYMAAFTAFALMTGLGIAAAPLAGAAVDYNEYTVTGLPQYITSPTPFTVNVDGPDSICSMEYKGITLNAAPWTFTYTLDGPDYASVYAYYCNTEYGREYIDVNTIAPYIFTTSMISVDGNGLETSREYKFRNWMDVPTTLTIANEKGTVVTTVVVPPESMTGSDGAPTVKVPVKGVKKTVRYTATATGANGVTQSASLWVAKGWSTMFGSSKGQWAPCSTVTWSFNPKGMPKVDNTFKKDVKAGLKRLSALTGLKFVEVPNGYEKPGTGEPADIRYRWGNLGKNGPSGLGGSDGEVIFNTKDWWPNNAEAGFGTRRGVPGRGWLAIHETMHTMLFDHVDDRTQVMNPVMYTHKFGAGDLAGLRVLYPKAGCRVS